MLDTVTCLILVDLQNDFCPGGALAVTDGDATIAVANREMASGKYNFIVATQDWHPANHGSFAANHLWKKPGQVIDLNGLQQVLWPIHCVQESFGAEFVKSLDMSLVNEVFRKGSNPDIDSYSGFYDNDRRQSTGMAEWLFEQGVTDVYVLGLATDFCVKFTALDALDCGFNTFLIKEGCRGVNLQEGDVEKAIEEMREQGVEIV